MVVARNQRRRVNEEIRPKRSRYPKGSGHLPDLELGNLIQREGQYFVVSVSQFRVFKHPEYRYKGP